MDDDYKYGCAVAGLVVALLAFAVWGIMFVAAWQSVPVDKVGLHYTGGPIEGQKFAGIIEPGSGATFLGLRDKLVELPITQRDYIVSRDASEGDRGTEDFITVPAKGGVEIEFEVAVYFTLNTEAKTVRRFYERICIKFDCTSSGGWDHMLTNNFRKPIEQALLEATREHTVNELYAGEAANGGDAGDLLKNIQTEIAGDLKDNINQVMGGRYFCGPTFDRNKPDVCPDFQFQIISARPSSDSVRNAFAANAASKQAKITAENNAAAKVAEAEGTRKSQEALKNNYNDPNYLEYLRIQAMQSCARSPHCVLVVSPSGTNVNVNTN